MEQKKSEMERADKIICIQINKYTHVRNTPRLKKVASVKRLNGNEIAQAVTV
jgi:hypothetical protein